MDGAKTVFTNGCFDLLHPGHLRLLERAKGLGDRLVVGINGDESVRAIKGRPRPYIDAEGRKAMLLGLRCVDQVVIYEELTPERVIEELRPDVLVKGGDWPVDEIIGAEFVRSIGGEVHSLPLEKGHSTSDLVNAISGFAANGLPEGEKKEAGPDDAGPAGAVIDEHIEAVADLLLNSETIDLGSDLLCDTVLAGGAVMICGNGGSAADAQHMAAELVGRYEDERRALKAFALTTDTSILTAVANDYGFERVFSRQIEASAAPGDLLVAISTSGTSKNVINAVMAARSAGCRVIGLTGAGGRKLASLSDRAVMVNSVRTSTIQEMHALIIHIWCAAVDRAVKGDQP